VQSIRKAIEEAELMAGCQIDSVFAGIAGGHIRGINSHGVIAVKNREIVENDIKRVIDAASAIAIPMDREVIHVLPQEYIVDDQDGIRDPIGMCGVRLEGKVHIVTGAVTSAQNIIRCANRAGLNVNDIVLEQLGCSEAVLSSEEKELGASVVDIGGGTTDLVIFSNGSIKHTSVLSLAGNHITSDISLGLRTPAEEAEKLKKRYGCALVSMVKKEEMIEVPSVGGRKPRTLSRQTLAEIIEPRVEEILTLVQAEIVRSGYANLIGSGLVLTGGTAIMEGMPEIAEQVFNLPVRRGYPVDISGLVDLVNSPIFATGVGLVMYGSKNRTKSRFRIGETNIFAKVSRRMRDWFGEFF
jgi:cell division protein FtsA